MRFVHAKPRRRVRRFNPDAAPIRWVIRTARETRRFTSLSQMGRSLSSNPISDDEWVTLERNDRVIYRGTWGGGIVDTPTLW